MKIEHEKLRELVHQLYEITRQFEEMFPERHFTPDGHMVGSLGEVLVADSYDLELMPASNKGYDAMSRCGKEVEIKCTQSKRVAFRSCSQAVIVIQLKKDGTFEEVYNGSGARVWLEFEGKTRPSNGQFSISLTKLRSLNLEASPSERVLPRGPKNDD